MIDPTKPDGKRMTRSQALLLAAPLAAAPLGTSAPTVISRKRATHFSPWIWAPWLAVFCVALGYLARGWFPLGSNSIDMKDPAKLAELADKATPLKPGPWGMLESVPFYIEPPEEYLPVKAVEESSRQWKFTGYNAAMLADLFNSADLDSIQKADLLDESKWTITGNGISLTPSDPLVLSLAPHSRKVIYGALALFPDNSVSQNRSYFPADKFDEYFSKSGLPSDTVALVKRLSFPHGKLLFFCDAPLVLSKLDSYPDKLRLMKVLTRKSTLLLRLHVTPETDINALTDYWAKGKWGKDIRPMLEALVDIPGGQRMGVGRFFPPHARDALFTFPYPSLNPDDAKKDCHYTALNFFNDTPDNRFLDVNNVKQTLTTDYYPVMSDWRYGDILELVRPNGEAIHSCVFIADNIVYTKNSAQPMEPCMLMTIPDLIDTFSSLIPETETLKIIGYRSKGD
ncbi:MAG TPA: hypothetical protein VG733_11205 [Chthoniobacteraceae bacterium]|nr:hypothetical protein [Chthoniobacteraceae bacterium]